MKPSHVWLCLFSLLASCGGSVKIEGAGGRSDGQIDVPPSCDPRFRATEVPEECLGNATTLEEGFPILADFYCGAP